MIIVILLLFWYLPYAFLLSNTDGDTVTVVLSKRLYASTLRVVADALRRDAVLVSQSHHNGIGTLGCQTIVNLVVTRASIGIAGNHHLSLRVLLQIVGNILHLLGLDVGNLERIDREEDVATDRLDNRLLLDDRLLDDGSRLLNDDGLGNGSGDEARGIGLTEVDL